MKLKVTVYGLLLFVFSSLVSQAQDINLRLIPVASQGTNGGIYEVKLQVSSSAAFNMGDFNIRFNYNANALEFLTLGTTHNFNSGSYDPISTSTFSNRVNVNGILNGTSGLAVSLAPGWTDIANLQFTIKDAAQTTGFVFRDYNASTAPTVIYSEKEVPITSGNLQPLDVAVTENTTLPVTLTSFTAKIHKNQGVVLNWVTATEKNNQEFQVERSENGKSFQVVATVRGAGNSLEINEYQALDPLPLSGTSYYRLKQVDFDGKFEYSALVSVKNQGSESFAINSVYPNPLHSKAEVRFTATPNTPISLTLTDLQGRVIWQEKLQVQQEQNAYTIDNLSNLTNGIFFVQLAGPNTSATYKVVKE